MFNLKAQRRLNPLARVNQPNSSHKLSAPLTSHCIFIHHKSNVQTVARKMTQTIEHHEPRASTELAPSKASFYDESNVKTYRRTAHGPLRALGRAHDQRRGLVKEPESRRASQEKGAKSSNRKRGAFGLRVFRPRALFTAR